MERIVENISKKFLSEADSYQALLISPDRMWGEKILLDIHKKICDALPPIFTPSNLVGLRINRRELSFKNDKFWRQIRTLEDESTAAIGMSNVNDIYLCYLRCTGSENFLKEISMSWPKLATGGKIHIVERKREIDALRNEFPDIEQSYDLIEIE